MIKIIIDTLGKTEQHESDHLLKGKENKGRVSDLIEQAQELLKTKSQESSTDADMYLDMALSALSTKGQKKTEGKDDSDHSGDRD